MIPKDVTEAFEKGVDLQAAEATCSVPIDIDAYKKKGNKDTCPPEPSTSTNGKEPPFWKHVNKEFAEAVQIARPKLGEREKIQIPGDDHLVSEFAAQLGAIYGQNKRLFNRHGVCVEVRLNEKTKTHELVAVTPHQFCTLIEEHCAPYYQREWENKHGRKSSRTINRTISVEDARKTLVSHDFLGRLAPISALNTVRLPILRNNGAIELLPDGYDSESGILTSEEVHFDTTWQLHKAVYYLKKLYDEFCFHPEDFERSRSVAIAGGLTLFCAHLLPKGSTRPNFMFTANAEGSGKTLLAKLAVVPLLGHMPTGSRPEVEAEMRKLILATVLAGSNVFFLDNLKGHLSSSSLEALTTSPVIRDRILGQSTVVQAEHGITVFLTGNDATISSDLRRRTLLVELFLYQARAEDRAIQNPLDDHAIIQARADVLAAYWGLVHAWDQARRPPGAIKHPSFHPWSELVGGILEKAGFANPCLRAKSDCSGDQTLSEIEKLISEMNPSADYKFADMVSLARDHGLFERMIGDDGELKPEQRSRFGKLLKKYANRHFTNGSCIAITGDTQKTRRYVLKEA